MHAQRFQHHQHYLLKTGKRKIVKKPREKSCMLHYGCLLVNTVEVEKDCVWMLCSEINVTVRHAFRFSTKEIR